MTTNSYDNYLKACKAGNLALVKEIISNSSAEEKKVLIKDHLAFYLASGSGNLELLHYIEQELADNKMLCQIIKDSVVGDKSKLLEFTEQEYAPFINAAMSGNTELLDWMISKFPSKTSKKKMLRQAVKVIVESLKVEKILSALKWIKTCEVSLDKPEKINNRNRKSLKDASLEVTETLKKFKDKKPEYNSHTPKRPTKGQSRENYLKP